MQSSVRSEAPRRVTISPPPPSLASIPRNGAVQIDQEISVVTSPAKSPTKGASYSPIPPLSKGHNRSQSDEPYATTPLNRCGSASRMSGRSLRHQSRPRLVHQDSKDPVFLETNRDTMKALADFLMTKEPPPNNWVSIPSDDEISLRSMKKSAFKIFGRQKKKVPKTPRFMQLPDSAVAAKTREGARHIAISIPLEHDHPQPPPAPYQSTPRPRSAPKQSRAPERGAVVVLKPVAEVRESKSSYLPRFTGSEALEGAGQVRPLSVVTPPADILSPEATRALATYNTQLNHQQRPLTAEEKKPEVARAQRRYIAITPVEMMQQDSQKSDPRHSGATVYSTTTMSTLLGHFRGVSSASTAPNVSPTPGRRLDLPPRRSSKSSVLLSLEAELAAESARVATLEQARKVQATPKPAGECVKSGTSTSQSPPAVFGTAIEETVKGYNLVGPPYFRTSTPQPSGSAPTKKLPDLPEGAGASVIRPLTAPTSQPRAISDISAKRSSSVKDNTLKLVQTTKQSRQEHVKARKQRDVAAIRIREEGNSQVSIPAISNTLSQTTVLGQSKRRSVSQELPLRRTANTMSPIMLVANLAPFTGLVLTSDLPSPPSKNVLRKIASSNSNTVRTHTPPQSMTESHGSDSDTIPRPRSRTRSNRVGSPSRSTRSSVLEARRQERRVRRNMSLHEKELDARLSKIERDNTMLLNTLSGIANSFGQLNKLLPGVRIPSRVIENMPREELGRETGMEGMEPIMRELQGAAPRVSKESVRRVATEGAVDEFDDDDGASIL